MSLRRPQSEPALGDGRSMEPHDWYAGWDSNPLLSAAPRSTMSCGDDATKIKVRRLGTGCLTPGTKEWQRAQDGHVDDSAKQRQRHDKPFPRQNSRPFEHNGEWRLRDSFIDKQTRAKAWIPEPGRYGNDSRLFDVKKETHYRENYPVERVVQHKFSRSKRPACDSFFRKSQGSWNKSLEEKHTQISSPRKEVEGVPIRLSKLPSSHFTAGVGGKFTPGPGHYTCFSSFGAPSGPTRHRFFGANGADNRGKGRPIDKFKVEHAADRGFSTEA